MACLMIAGTSFAQNLKMVKAKSLMSEKENVTVESLLTPKLRLVDKPNYIQQKANANSTVIVSENFAKFTAGSEDTPDNTIISNLETGEIPSSYTQTPGWSGAPVYQAGGSAYIGMLDESTSGFINTPILDFSQNGGTCKVSFRAKSVLAEGDQLSVLILVPGEQYASSSVSVNLTNEWQDFSVTLNQGKVDNYIQIWTYSNEFFIDDINITSEGLNSPSELSVSKFTGTSAELSWNAVEGADSYLLNVYYFDLETYENIYAVEEEAVTGTSYTVSGLDPNITYLFDVATVKGEEVSPYSSPLEIVPNTEAPEMLPISDYTGTSFTINWKAVEGASKYLVSLYSSDSEDNLFPVFEREEVTGTSKEVTDLDPETVYYYQVQAQFADGSVSKPSKYIAALPELDKPIIKEATNLTANGFTANWEPVEFANTYMATLYRKHEATADEKYKIADASFDNLESAGTIENPELIYNSYIFTAEDGAYGWTISLAAKIDGAIGFDNSFAMFFGPALLYSQPYDFGQADGKVNLKFKAIANTDDQLLVTFATIENNQLVPIESSAQMVNVGPTMKEYSLTLENGIDGCVIVMLAQNNANVYFNTLKADVDLKKGSVFNTTEASEISLTESYDFNNLDAANGDSFSYDVVAALIIGTEVVTSEVSDKMEVTLPTSISKTQTDKSKVYIEGEDVHIINPYGESIEVYSAEGTLLHSDNSGSETSSVRLPVHGIYIVKVGSKAYKIAR